ncbi:MAG: DUF1272 domain-containing protein [Flavobacteriales bacterium]
MLALRPTCEHCNKPLPPHSTEAMICSFECTFCSYCASHLLHNVCPNCGGGFEKRPVRPRQKLPEYPAQTKVVFKPVDMEVFQEKLKAYKHITPENR